MRRTAEQVRWSIEDPLLAVLALSAAWLVWSDFWPGGAPWAAAVIIVGCLVVGVERQLAHVRSGASPVGSRQLVRTALIAAATVLQPELGPVFAIGTVLAMLVGVAGLIMEPAIARGAASKLIFVHRLPGVVPLPERRRWLPPLVLWSSLGATIVGAGSGWVGRTVAVGVATQWVWLLAAVVPALALFGLLLETAQRIRRHHATERNLAKAIAAYGPRFVIYTARPDDASYQVLMWLPYLERAGVPFLIVTRDELPARALAERTDVPIVTRRTISGLDDVIAPSLRAAFYVNASSGNGAFIRYGHLTHVYLGHGDSDKPPSYNPTHAMYDQIFAAGPAAVRRYAEHGVRIPADRFRIVGRPQVEDVVVVDPADRSRPAPQTVLYAPTWRGHVTETQLSSLPVGMTIVEALLARGMTVIFRPHPFSYHFADDAALVERIQRRLAEDAAATGRKHVWGAPAESERTVLDCTNESDAMIADVSAIVSDYLYSQKPFAMVAVPDGDFTAQYPITRGAYVIDGDLANLDPVLDDLLGEDPHREVRARIRADYLGDFPADGYADVFVSAVREVSTAGSAEHTGRGLSEPDEPSRPTRRANLKRQLSALAGGAVAGALGGLALAAVLLARSGAGPVATVIGLAGVLVTGWLRRKQLLRPTVWGGLTGFAGPARLLLAVGLGLVAVPGPVPLSIMLALVASVAAEPAIKRGWGRQGVEVANLPELGAELSQPLPLRAGWVLSLLALAVGWLLWWTPVDGVPTLVLVAGSLLITIGGVALAAVRVHRVVRAEERLPEVVRDRAPRFAAYFASPVGARYQLGMWLPYFDRIGEPYVIITRDLKMQREIARIATVPVIYRPTLASLEEVIVPSLTTCFYVNNAVKNTHFIERRELTHVWLNHGDSEKPACFNPVHAIYDLIFAAGQAGIDRYARHGVRIPAEKFRIVGRPQVEQIRPADPVGPADGRPTVLYAPTWQGTFADTRVYSLPVGEQIVAALLARGARVIFRAHPFNYRYPPAVELIKQIQARLAADPGGGHVWGPAAEEAMSVEDCFNASDAMISDVSAVVSDYLQSDKPFAIVSVGRTPEQLVQEAPAARAAYVLEDDLNNLESVLDDLLGADPLAAERSTTRVYYLGDFPRDSYADGFLDRARAVIARTDPLFDDDAATGPPGPGGNPSPSDAEPSRPGTEPVVAADREHG